MEVHESSSIPPNILKRVVMGGGEHGKEYNDPVKREGQ
jgi:hypothetical protein